MNHAFRQQPRRDAAHWVRSPRGVMAPVVGIASIVVCLYAGQGLRLLPQRTERLVALAALATVAQSALAAGHGRASRTRRGCPEAALRPRVRGKFLSADGKEFLVRGVTYGPLAPEREQSDVVERDLAAIAASGINTVRTYSLPSRAFLDTAWKHGLRVMVGLAWEQHVAFLDDRRLMRSICERVRGQVEACIGHPAVLCYVVGNEIPAPVVRWHGARRVERFLQHLCWIVRATDPTALVTYVNYPSTEYLQLDFVDFLCFNVYLETPEALQRYLARLQNLAGNRPLVMGEIGVDSRRHGTQEQAHMLDWQVRSAFAAGCAGVCVFAWTDEWHRGGHDIDDWDFGLTDRQRRPKPALAAVRRAYAEVPYAAGGEWPSVSVVVCAYNAEDTMRECCEGLAALDYPDYEVIIVDDGSTDDTRAIAEQYAFRVISTPNRGLSNARNIGLAAARGAIVAYIDSDAYPDPRWLQYLAVPFAHSEYGAVGGPNLTPENDAAVAQCVGRAPGGPTHVLITDSEAEHIPGCNMAFRKHILEELGGFDPQFRIAGDDVDVCWRLRDAGWILGFSPAAVVWHHPRGSLGAYWRQQLRYGEAEAILQRKWPARYSRFGHPAWEGQLYCDSHRRRLSWPSRGRVYHGVWGSAPFQSLYARSDGWLRVLTLMPEWYLVIVWLLALSALGFAWRPLFLFVPLLMLAIAVPLVDAAMAVPGPQRSRRDGVPSGLGWRLFGMSLHLLQPLARLVGRIEQGVTPWGWGAMRHFAWPLPMSFTLWTENWQEPAHWLERVNGTLVAQGIAVRTGGCYDRWDLAVAGGIFGGARACALVEEHGSGRQLLRVRVWPTPARRAAGVALVALALPAILAAGHSAWVAAVVLGAATLLLVAVAAQQSASALAAIRGALEMLEERPGLRQERPQLTDPRSGYAKARVGHRLVQF